MERTHWKSDIPWTNTVKDFQFLERSCWWSQRVFFGRCHNSGAASNHKGEENLKLPFLPTYTFATIFADDCLIQSPNGSEYGNTSTLPSRHFLRDLNPDWIPGNEKRSQFNNREYVHHATSYHTLFDLLGLLIFLASPTPRRQCKQT